MESREMMKGFEVSSWSVEMCSCSTSGTIERRLGTAFFPF